VSDGGSMGSRSLSVREVIINLIFQESAESQVGKQVASMLGGEEKNLT